MCKIYTRNVCDWTKQVGYLLVGGKERAVVECGESADVSPGLRRITAGTKFVLARTQYELEFSQKFC